MALTVHQFPCLEGNYGFLVRDARTGSVACIDPPDARPVLRELAMLSWSLDLILNTHWHHDHAGANAEVRAATGAKVVAPAEVARTSPVDAVIVPGDLVHLGATRFEVIDTGGHTAGHVSYHDPASGTAFVGDALFVMGCGRLFEGTPEQMWRSLARLAALPPTTTIYCAHEYTEANARFAIAQDPSPAVRRRFEEVRRHRAVGRWTVPTTIGEELETNPFLRAPRLVPELDAVDAFARLRRAKDDFIG